MGWISWWMIIYSLLTKLINIIVHLFSLGDFDKNKLTDSVLRKCTVVTTGANAGIIGIQELFGRPLHFVCLMSAMENYEKITRNKTWENNNAFDYFDQSLTFCSVLIGNVNELVLTVSSSFCFNLCKYINQVTSHFICHIDCTSGFKFSMENSFPYQLRRSSVCLRRLVGGGRGSNHEFRLCPIICVDYCSAVEMYICMRQPMWLLDSNRTSGHSLYSYENSIPRADSRTEKIASPAQSMIINWIGPPRDEWLPPLIRRVVDKQLPLYIPSV